MSKLSQIENALKGIDQAQFHSLCDSYLHLKGYEGVNPLGRVIGADKVRPGTPDTCITQPDGSFIFAEDSTEQKRLAKKFEEDENRNTTRLRTGNPGEIYRKSGDFLPACKPLRMREKAGALVVGYWQISACGSKDSKSGEAYTSWGFDSPSGTNGINNLAKFSGPTTSTHFSPV